MEMAIVLREPTADQPAGRPQRFTSHVPVQHRSMQRHERALTIVDHENLCWLPVSCSTS